MSESYERVDVGNEKVPPSGWGAVAVQAVAPLLLLLLLNWPAQLYLRAFTWDHYVDSQKWILARRPDRQVRWVVLGDSSGLLGVYPPELEHGLGGHAINLARHAGPVSVEDAWLLDEYLKHHPAPRGVFAVYCYISLQDGVNPSGLALLPLSDGFWTRRKPALALDWERSWEVYCSEHFPLLTYPETLNPPFLRPWNAFRGLARIYLQPDGFLDAPPDPAAVKSQAQDNARSIAARVRLQVSPANEQGARRLAELADQKGFELYLVPGPAWEGLADSPAYQRGRRLLLDLARPLTARYRHVHVLLPSRAFFPASQMENDVHLTMPGARIFTRSIVEALRATPRLTGQR